MLNRSNIEEANKHLQALYGRVNELEHVISEQHDALMAKDSFIQTKVTEISQQDSMIANLRQQLTYQDQKAEQAEQTISNLQSKVQTLSTELDNAQRKNEALSNIINVIPELKSLITRIEDIAISVDETSITYQANTSTTTSSVADGDNTDVIITGKKGSPIKQGSISDMAKEFNMQSEKLKKFSISEDEDETGPQKQSDTSSSKTKLKEYYF